VVRAALINRIRVGMTCVRLKVTSLSHRSFLGLLQVGTEIVSRNQQGLVPFLLNIISSHRKAFLLL